MVKDGTGKVTLTNNNWIGDGANDVGMLHEADIGISISSVEGLQVTKSTISSLNLFSSYLMYIFSI